MFDAALTVIGIFICFIIGGCTGADMARQSYTKQAISVGVAEWHIDSKSGEKTLFWLVGGTNMVPYKKE
jgi:hypothetical protein